ncbi:hypothetical protein M885DRAFT_577885 [Pelagophyceae sp. CCMP2097]|nr:hypothetical protein M885DRAFT_577885 [Pelagophyceae sp. CCMP2097]
MRYRRRRRLGYGSVIGPAAVCERVHRRLWHDARRLGFARVLALSRAPASAASVVAYAAAVAALPWTQRALLGDFLDFAVEPLKRAFAFAVPSRAAVGLVAQHARHGGVVEAGCGAGLWAAALRARGVSVDAFDAAPTGNAPAGHENTFHTFHHRFVFRGADEAANGSVAWIADAARADAAAAVTASAASTLLICWPPRAGDGAAGRGPPRCLATYALAAFRGRCVASVGEGAACAGHAAAGRGGPQTGSAAFRAALRRDFRRTAVLRLPPMPFANDRLTIWRRRGATPPAAAWRRRPAAGRRRRGAAAAETHRFAARLLRTCARAWRHRLAERAPRTDAATIE